MAERLADDLQRSQRAYASDLTGEGFIVRRCRQADVSAVLDLWAQARSEHASTPDRLEDVEFLVADSPAALLVAERDGRSSVP
jgi:ribosomal protein S18 acetylase RimI-like enzyme